MTADFTWHVLPRNGYGPNRVNFSADKILKYTFNRKYITMVHSTNFWNSTPIEFTYITIVISNSTFS